MKARYEISLDYSEEYLKVTNFNDGPIGGKMAKALRSKGFEFANHNQEAYLKIKEMR